MKVKLLTNLLYWACLFVTLNCISAESVAQDSVRVNSLERFDEFDEFYFQKNFNTAEDGVLLDRSQTFNVNMLGFPGAACMEKIKLSSSGTLSSEVFGRDGEVKAVLSKQGYCSQPNDAYAFSDGFANKNSAFAFLKSLKSFPLLTRNEEFSSDKKITVFEVLGRNIKAPTIQKAFCGFTSEEFQNYVSGNIPYSFVMLAIFGKDTRWPDDCVESEEMSEGQSPALRMAIVKGEYFEISKGNIVGIDPVAGTVFKYGLSHPKFCFFGNGYSFAVLSRQALEELAQRSEERVPTKIKQEAIGYNRQQVNRLIAKTVERELKKLCGKG